jgi:CubicO group peptidase (beta-lactamase class C family)
VKQKDLLRELGSTIPRLMTEGEVPGLQMEVVRGGRLKSFGVKNAETGGAVTDETIFEAASLSKPSQFGFWIWDLGFGIEPMLKVAVAI